MSDGMEQPNQDKIKPINEKETYKYLGILEASATKKVDMGDKIKKEYLRRTRKLPETKLGETLSKELIAALCPSLDIRDPLWSGPERIISKWTKEQGN